MTLSSRIDNFVEKAVHFASEEEARQYGVKLPPSEKKPEAKTKSKTPDVVTPSKPNKKVIGGFGSEVARQLTPKGPYRSTEDIAEDARESKRLGNRVADFVTRKKGY
jgi:hypothetical protein